MNDNQFYDYNLELTVLSSILFSPESFITIDEELFVHPTLKNIYKTIQDLCKKDLPIEETIIRNYLVNTLKMKKQDVEDVLINILATTPASNIEAYISQLQELRRKREVQKTLFKINQDVLENRSADELESTLLSYAEKISTKSSTNFLNLTPALSVNEKESEFITKDFIPIPKNTVTIFSAGGGTGKTSLLLQLAMRFLNENKNEKCFMWLSEDPLGLTKHRLNTIIDGLYSQGKQTLNRLILSDDLTFSVLEEQNRNIVINSLFYKMRILLKDYSLIILDPLIAFFGGDENNNAQAKLFMQLFTKWAGEENKTIVFIHHSTKNTSQSRGASAFTDAARAVYEIQKIKDEEENEIKTNERKVVLSKDNYRASKYLGGFEKIVKVFPNERKAVAVEIEYKMDVPLFIEDENTEDEYEIS